MNSGMAKGGLWYINRIKSICKLHDEIINRDMAFWKIHNKCGTKTQEEMYQVYIVRLKTNMETQHFSFTQSSKMGMFVSLD